MKMLFRSGDIGATVREIEFKTDIFLFYNRSSQKDIYI